MKAPLYVLEKKVAGKWKPQRFWAGVARVRLIENSNLRVRRVKTVAEAILLSNPSVSMLDIENHLRRNSNRYEWVIK